VTDDARAGNAAEAFRATAAIRIAHPNGLHARPAIRLTKLAKRFGASVAIGRSAEGPWFDAKSVVNVMAMKAPRDVMLYFSATGSDAQAAVDALVALVAADFATGEPE
jgi:phosphocarrier protein